MTKHHTAEELVKQAASFSTPKKGKHPRWWVVMNVFGVGFTTATEICRACGLDPDKIVKSA
jgi:ribosomal protein S13